jgi:lipopolysaccharide/colanic/teichoic acid biosynthesis glycosyltransferase
MHRATVDQEILGKRDLPLDFPAGGNELSRAIQVILSLGAVLVLSPVLLIVALAVKLTSPGPVLYRGQRVGKAQRIFDIYKFRTLTVGAEKQIGARLLKEEDQVYTKIGRFLKKTKLDELPQLFNVIKGDMNLVGPRPVRPVFLETFRREIPDYGLRFQVRPGMTGLAQVRGGYWTDPRDKLRYELVYIKNQSLFLDLKLMGLTFIKIFNRLVTTSVFLAALFLFVSFFPTRLHPWLYATIWGMKVNLVYVAIVLLGIWMIAKTTYAHRLYLYRSQVYLPMAGFVAAGFASAVFSPDPETAVRGTAYYLVTGFMVTLTLLNTRFTVGFARSAATLAGLACCALSLVGLLELALIKHSVLSRGDASGWAIKATLANPNVLAAYLVLGFPLLLCQLIHARTRDGRDFWLVSTTIAFTSILLTQNLLGLLALLAASAVFLVYTSSRTVPLLICIFLIPILVLGAWDEAAAPTQAYRSLQAKFATEARTLATVPVRQLILGSGPKSLQPRAPGVTPQPPRDLSGLASNNMHLSLILETGIVGWLLMLWILGEALRVIYRGARQAKDAYHRSLLWAIFSSAVGFLISMSGFDVFLQIPLQVFFWGLVGLGLGMVTHVVTRRSPFFTIWRFGEERPRPERRRPLQERASPGRPELDPSPGVTVAE